METCDRAATESRARLEQQASALDALSADTAHTRERLTELKVKAAGEQQRCEATRDQIANEIRRDAEELRGRAFGARRRNRVGRRLASSSSSRRAAATLARCGWRNWGVSAAMTAEALEVRPDAPRPCEPRRLMA